MQQVCMAFTGTGLKGARSAQRIHRSYPWKYRLFPTTSRLKLSTLSVLHPANRYPASLSTYILKHSIVLPQPNCDVSQGQGWPPPGQVEPSQWAGFLGSNPGNAAQAGTNPAQQQQAPGNIMFSQATLGRFPPEQQQHIQRVLASNPQWQQQVQVAGSPAQGAQAQVHLPVTVRHIFAGQTAASVKI